MSQQILVETCSFDNLPLYRKFLSKYDGCFSLGIKIAAQSDLANYTKSLCLFSYPYNNRCGALVSPDRGNDYLGTLDREGRTYYKILGSPSLVDLVTPGVQFVIGRPEVILEVLVGE